MAQTRAERIKERAEGSGRFERKHEGSASNDPDSPSDLEKSDFKSVLKRTFKEFKEDNLTDWAAALTYYGVLSLAPGLLVLVSLLGVFGTSATQPLMQSITALAPGPARDILTSTVENLTSANAAGVAFFIGIAAALWSASNYVGAFIRAANAIYEVEEGRPFWKLRPLQIALTVVGVVILALISVLVVISGPLAQQAGNLIGLGDLTVTIYNIAKWPVIAIILALMIAGLYYIGPNVKHPKFQWVSPGGIIAIVLWVVASLAFALYVANFPPNPAYGTIGAVILFLTWLWISNIAILLGLEMNAELERQQKIKEGMPATQEPFLPPKDDPKT